MNFGCVRASSLNLLTETIHAPGHPKVVGRGDPPSHTGFIGHFFKERKSGNISPQHPERCCIVVEEIVVYLIAELMVKC
jgi:hypothetical protein